MIYFIFISGSKAFQTADLDIALLSEAVFSEKKKLGLGKTLVEHLKLTGSQMTFPCWRSQRSLEELLVVSELECKKQAQRHQRRQHHQRHHLLHVAGSKLPEAAGLELACRKQGRGVLITWKPA